MRIFNSQRRSNLCKWLSNASKSLTLLVVRFAFYAFAPTALLFFAFFWHIHSASIHHSSLHHAFKLFFVFSCVYIIILVLCHFGVTNTGKRRELKETTSTKFERIKLKKLYSEDGADILKDYQRTNERKTK